jgi:hypothetical protein
MTIESLMRQTVKPDRIILWLSEEEYPGQDKDKLLPQTLIDLKARGLEIRWTPKNTRALKKLLTALEAEIPANIITADDDIIYHRDWLKRLQKSHKQHPEALHATIAQHVPVNNGQMTCFQGTGREYYDEKGCYDKHWFPEGCGGILYPYDASGKTCYGLDWIVLDEKHLPYGYPNDDLWFYLCRVLAGTPFYLLGYAKEENFRMISLAEPLSEKNVEQGRNNVVLRQLLKDFPEFAAKLGVDVTKPQCVPPAR